ncbi:MAG TPA: anti-sigma factor [Calditrichia bacterium]|nr:anti-sigma factor [Calditrichia bacterium]HQV32544.1 anti-sigma factor [Calditrichia bacterium]
MDREKLTELAAGYSLGALEDRDREAFEALLNSGNSEAIRALREMQVVAGLLPASVEPVQASPELKDRIMKEITGNPGSRPENVTSMPPEQTLGFEGSGTVVWPWAAAILLMVAAMGWGYSAFLHGEITDLNTRLEMGNEVIRNLEGELSRNRQVMAILGSPDLQKIELGALEGAPARAHGRVLLDPQTRKASFSASALASLPADRDYQLWMLKGNQPVDAGLLTLTPEGDYRLDLETINPEELSAFAVTIEPKGGVPQPTGTMVLLGTVGG